MPHQTPLDYHITFDGPMVRIAGDGDELTMELSAPHLVDRQSGVFAAWILLPIAMTKHRDIRIFGAGGDDVTCRNFEALSRIWSAWMPQQFATAKVSFIQAYDAPRSENGNDLLLYSGGADSTYNLLRRHEAGLQQTLLTIHGIDYRFADGERFEELVAMTDPLVRMTSSDRIFCRTNVYDVYRKNGIDADFGHAFVLASNLFLHGSPFRQGEVSADFARHQEFLAYPWGTNSITNALFESSSFRMHTANLDLTRARKFNLIAKYPTAITSLSFCKTYTFRPKNCGICRRCVTNKLMFLAACGEFPDIFAHPSLESELLDVIDLTNRVTRAFLTDIVETAARNGFSDRIPGLDKKFAELRLNREEAMKKVKAPKKEKKPSQPEPRRRSWVGRLFRRAAPDQP